MNPEPGVNPGAGTASTKIDWKTRVSASGGVSLFLPDKFKADADEIENLRKEFNDVIKSVAQKEIAMNMATQTMFYEVRKFLAENGRDDVWTKEIGFDGRALQDGEYVLNLREHQR